MQIQKIYAVIRTSTIQETGANCQVYCIVTDYDKIYDTMQIKELLGNDFVFSKKIFTPGNQLSIGDFIEIPFKELQRNDPPKNPYILHEPVKKAGYRVIDVPVEFISEDNYIDCEKVTKFISDGLNTLAIPGKFYLSSNGLYGPFKIESGCVLPFTGKSAFRYDFDVDEIIDLKYDGKDCPYIISEPKNKVAELDCMSKNQVLEHLKKTLILHQSINIDINKIRDIRDGVSKANEGAEHLDHIRLKRAAGYLDSLLLSYNELNALKKHEEAWERLINDNYTSHKEKFEADILAVFQSKINEKESELTTLNLSLQSAKETLASQSSDIVSLSEDIRLIESKKHDLILSIQVAAGVQPNSVSRLESEDTAVFYRIEQQFSELQSYDDHEDYLDDMSNMGLIAKSQKKYLKEGLFWMSRGNFLLADNCAYVLTLVRSIGNFKAIVQNAEIDWIKYEYLHRSGFSALVKSALENKDIYHFYILQDINIASPECYAKPILDIARGIHLDIPGTTSKWPKNLFFIGIAVDDQIRDFGFGLNKSSFSKWKALPQNDEAFLSQEFTPKKRIDLNSIAVDFDYPETIDCYIA